MAGGPGLQPATSAAGSRDQEGTALGIWAARGTTARLIHVCREVISKSFLFNCYSAIYSTVYKRVSDLVSNLYLKINIIDSEF